MNKSTTHYKALTPAKREPIPTPKKGKVMKKPSVVKKPRAVPPPPNDGYPPEGTKEFKALSLKTQVEVSRARRLGVSGGDKLSKAFTKLHPQASRAARKVQKKLQAEARKKARAEAKSQKDADRAARQAEREAKRANKKPRKPREVKYEARPVRSNEKDLVKALGSGASVFDVPIPVDVLGDGRLLKALEAYVERKGFETEFTLVGKDTIGFTVHGAKGKKAQNWIGQFLAGWLACFEKHDSR